MDNLVIVKKWFDAINGNTYHSVQVKLMGKTLHSGKVYGYGNQYEETLKKMIKEFSCEHYNNELGYKNLDAIVIDVKTSTALKRNFDFQKVLVS